ncbi:MAG: efflux RND transporter permease subunit [Chloroflexi bacterium]|nr:efflux RND transporter permease subunit [Chloroflexota bacterium]
MFLTRLALRLRVLTILLMVGVMVAGVYGVSKLRIELFPDIEFPLVIVSAFYPQATPDAVLRDVTIPVEQAVRGVDNVTMVRSTSSPSFALILVEAPFGVDMKAMERDIAQRVQALHFPAGVQPPRVSRVNPDEFPVLQVSILGQPSIPDLYGIVSSQVLPALRAVPGVGGADVPLGAEAGLSIIRTNGSPSLSIGILKTPDANTVEVSHAVGEALEALKPAVPADVQFIELFDQAPGIEDSINELKQEVLLGAILAVLVIFAFLLSVRPTLVTSTSIPVSILAALIVMHWQGMSLNILTLGGLAIAVGRVVDDSIVVMENIFRHIQQGEDRRTAAFNATREVASPVTASTLTTIAVFAPLGFIGGFIGVVFLPFALTITFALLASLVVALTVVPVLASLLLAPSNGRRQRGSSLERLYAAIIRWSLQHKLRTLAIAAALFVASVGLVAFIPVSFLPSSGQVLVNAQIAVPGAASQQEVLDQLAQAEVALSKMRSDGVIEAFQSTVGNTGQFGAAQANNSASLVIQLPEDADASQVTETLKRDLPGPGRTVAVSTSSDSGPQSNNLELTLLGGDYAVLTEAANKVTLELQKMPGLTDLRNDAAIAGQTPGADGLLTINRVDGRRAVTISGAITDRNTGKAQRDVRQTIDRVGLPPGVEVSTGGVFASINEAFSQMAVAMLLGLALVYLVMVVTQRSLVTPFVIVFSLPLASIGALGGLFITQRTLGLPALIGILMLIGLVVTNAIVLIAFVEDLRRRGISASEALVQGGRTRLRPILMTALTTIFVLLPLALGLGGRGSGIIGAELATVVIGGLMTATFLTLVVIPIVYSYLRRKGPKAQPAPSAADD